MSFDSRLSLSDDKRSIVHMDLDAFFVSVERLHNSDFIGKPLIIGGTSDRGVVAACSYEARTYGLHSAMPIRRARQLCPNGIYIKGDMESYSKFSQLVTDVIADKVPLYEKASIDEFYIDLSGMDRFYGCYKYATELRQSITKETGLPISFGLSINKTVSKIGTNEAKPNGQINIDKGTEKVFLAPLSIAKIPQLGKVTFHTLRGMGIAKIVTLQEMPVQLMERVLGKMGIVLWKKANGIDNSAVHSYSERKSISTERTFNSDTTDVSGLKARLLGMVEKLTFQLRQENKLTACVAVKIRYANFDTLTKQLRIPYTSADHIIIPLVYELFEKLYNRRLRIRLVGIRFSHMVQGSYQINLFDDTPKMINLYQTMDSIRNRFGKHAVERAAASMYKKPVNA